MQDNKKIIRILIKIGSRIMLSPKLQKKPKDGDTDFVPVSKPKFNKNLNLKMWI